MYSRRTDVDISWKVIQCRDRLRYRHIALSELKQQSFAQFVPTIERWPLGLPTLNRQQNGIDDIPLNRSAFGVRRPQRLAYARGLPRRRFANATPAQRSVKRLELLPRHVVAERDLAVRCARASWRVEKMRMRQIGAGECLQAQRAEASAATVRAIRAAAKRTTAREIDKRETAARAEKHAALSWSWRVRINN